MVIFSRTTVWRDDAAFEADRHLVELVLKVDGHGEVQSQLCHWIVSGLWNKLRSRSMRCQSFQVFGSKVQLPLCRSNRYPICEQGTMQEGGGSLRRLNNLEVIPKAKDIVQVPGSTAEVGCVR